jgi:hypothetical protein
LGRQNICGSKRISNGAKNLIGLMMKIGLIVTVLLFEGLNTVHKESIVQDYLTTVTRLIVFLYPADPRLKPINTFKRQILNARLVVCYFQSSLDTKDFNT